MHLILFFEQLEFELIGDETINSFWQTFFLFFFLIACTDYFVCYKNFHETILSLFYIKNVDLSER